MAKSKNNRITKRGNHAQRLRSHDEYLISKFPGFSNMTNPYTAPVAEMIEEELKNGTSEIVEAGWNEEEGLDDAVILEGEIVDEDVMKATQELLLTGKVGN